MFVRELEYAVRERCRKQQVEPSVCFRQASEYVANVLDEAEVEHAIGFVEHQDFDVTKREDFLLLKVDGSAWCANQDIHARGEMLTLLVVIRATKGQTEPIRKEFAELDGISMDLDGELARRRENQRPRPGSPLRLRCVPFELTE